MLAAVIAAGAGPGIFDGLLDEPLALAEDAKAACVDANTRAQDLRRSGKLSAAREQLRRCADPSCPSVVSDDCTKRLDELNQVQPTIVFEVKDSSGRDVASVAVSMDGAPLADSLTGAALAVDPGPHTFRFEVAGRAPVEEHLVLHEGEKGRAERVVIGGVGATSASAEPLAATGASSPMRTIGLFVGGAGVVSVGLGAVFGVMAASQWSTVKGTCGGDVTHCMNVPDATSERSSGETDATISTIGFVAGGALLAGGAFLFFTAPSRTEAGAVSIAPILAPGVGGLFARGAF